jgi:hypothetical protein
MTVSYPYSLLFVINYASTDAVSNGGAITEKELEKVQKEVNVV